MNDELKHGSYHELRTDILIDLSLVDANSLFPKNEKILIFMIFRATGNVKDLSEAFSLTLEPPNYAK